MTNTSRLALSPEERIDYTNAVLCLQNKPARTHSTLAPGARSHFDDFTVTYMNQTLRLQYTGIFLSWHRYFTWVYEEALRTECNYAGTQPYWDFASTALDMTSSPLFDGSATSMSGNGAHIDQSGDVDFKLGPFPAIPLPHGDGGGCVTSGPFANMTINLGPVSLLLPGNKTASATDPYSHNPRCLKRDLGSAINGAYANATSIYKLLAEYDNIYDFQMTMQGIPGSGALGIHSAAHLTIGGDPGRDLFTAPSDPMFFLLHSEIDRLWWIWQALNIEDRLHAVAGTDTPLGGSPSANVTLDTVINVGFAKEGDVRVGDLMSTVGGSFCYIYA